MRMDSGMRSQIRPLIMIAARSDDPIPVAKAFRAPYVTAWLSAPTARLPGVARPDSTTS